MAVAADELMIRFAVEPETIFAAEFRIAYSHVQDAAVYCLSAVHHAYLHIIQIWRLRAPEMRRPECGVWRLRGCMIW